ncbi:MAG: hypothetical protein JWL58_3635 [Streptosporangiaceae bacterium]|nr:hypothetical protein [Streptosporangiaceae bacterium]
MLSAVLFPGTAGGTAVPDSGGDRGGRLGIRLLDAPVIRKNDPRARTYVVDHLAPGTTIMRRLVVSNMSAIRKRIEMYPAAARIDHNRFVFMSGRTPNELTTWISLDHSVVDLAPRGSAVVKTTIRLPKTAWRGEQYAVIWAQEGVEPTASHRLGAINRVGIRVYLDVGPGGEPPSDFQIESLTPSRDPAGSPQIVAQVRNTGGRALDMSGRLSLSEGPGGLKAGPFPASVGVTLAPGDAAPVKVLLDEHMPAGPWKVRLTLASGLVKRTVTATLTFPDSGIGKPQEMGFHPSLPVLLAVLTALASATVLLWVRRRYRSRVGAR